MEGMCVGTCPWHLSPSFFLLAVPVLARHGGRGGRPGPEPSPGEPGGGRPRSTSPRPKSTPGCGSPKSGEAGKAESAGVHASGAQTLGPFPPLPGNTPALTSRAACQGCHQPGPRSASKSAQEAGAGHPPEDVGPNAKGRGVCGNMDVPTPPHGESQGCVMG